MVYFLYHNNSGAADLPEFEFDEGKSAANQEKHGIDFEAVQALWLDGDRVELPVRSEHEERLAIVGQIDDKHWTAIVTYRDDRVRLISARRARREEIARYEEDFG